MLEVISDKPLIRIWKDKKKGVDNLLLNTDASNRKEFVLGSAEYPSLSSLPTSIFIEGIAESEVAGDVQLVSKYVANGQEYELDRLVISVMNVEMRVDADRNGVVSFVDLRLNKPKLVNENSYTFWVNDDFDKMHYEVAEEWHEDDDTNAYPTPEPDQDWNDDRIGNLIPYLRDELDGPLQNACKRDLEDFAMLQMLVPAWLKEMQGVVYSVKFENANTFDGPAINLFEAVDERNLYISDEAKSSEQILKTRLNPDSISGSFEFEVPRELIEKGGGRAPFIFEGAAKGTGDLVFSVKVDGVTLAQSRINLQLHEIKEFYDEYEVGVTGTRWEAFVDKYYTKTNSAEIENVSEEYLLFVHGINVVPDGLKKRWAETLFKRLWWKGYQGRVGIFKWPCLEMSYWTVENVINARTFNNSDFIAWQSAYALQSLLGDLKAQGKKLGVLAHSQGNVLLGEALKIYTGPKIDTYIASQAAISASVYDNAATLKMKTFGLGFRSPDIYGFFESGLEPDLPYLTGNRNKVVNNNMFNFYNTEDYALGTWDINSILKPTDVNPYLYDYVESKEQYVKYHVLDPDLTGSLDINKARDRYEIFSYIVESRTRALGTQEVSGEFDIENNINLQEEDLDSPFDKTHYSHSRQFRSNLVSEKGYWDLIMDKCAFSSTME